MVQLFTERTGPWAYWSRVEIPNKINETKNHYVIECDVSNHKEDEIDSSLIRIFKRIVNMKVRDWKPQGCNVFRK